MNDLPPTRVGEVWTRKDGDQTAVFDPSTGTLSRMNPSALAIWELCDGETQQDEVVDALVELTGRTRSEVADEVEGTLLKLRKLGLLK
jgi:hypothetical protein